jgi:hypothetical protein
MRLRSCEQSSGGGDTQLKLHKLQGEFGEVKGPHQSASQFQLNITNHFSKEFPRAGLGTDFESSFFEAHVTNDFRAVPNRLEGKIRYYESRRSCYIEKEKRNFYKHRRTCKRRHPTRLALSLVGLFRTAREGRSPWGRPGS